MEQSSCEGMISDMAIADASKGFCPVGINDDLRPQYGDRHLPHRYRNLCVLALSASRC